MILLFPGLALVTLRWRWQKHFCNTYGTHSCAIWSRCLGFEPPGHRRWFAMELIIIDLGKSSLHCLMLCHLNSLYHMSEWSGLKMKWKTTHIFSSLMCVGHSFWLLFCTMNLSGRTITATWWLHPLPFAHYCMVGITQSTRKSIWGICVTGHVIPQSCMTTWSKQNHSLWLARTTKARVLIPFTRN